MSAIKIVLDITRLVEEGKLTAQEAERLQALARRDTGSLAINVLMSFGAVAVAAGIIALEPAYATGSVLGVALVAIGLAISFLAARQSSARRRRGSSSSVSSQKATTRRQTHRARPPPMLRAPGRRSSCHAPQHSNHLKCEIGDDTWQTPAGARDFSFVQP